MMYVLSAVRYIAYQETLLHVQIKSRDQEIILLRKINLIRIFFYQQFGLMTEIPTVQSHPDFIFITYI